MTDKYGGYEVHSADEFTAASGVFMTLYGKGGIGKTTLAYEAHLCEYTKPAMFLDMEGGIRAISDDPTLKVIHTEQFSETSRFLNKVKLDAEFPWKTIVVDNISELQSMNLKGLSGSGMPTLPEYGKSQLEMVDFVRDCRALTLTRGLNIIVCAWDCPEKEESTGIIKRDIQFTPSLQERYPGLVEIIGHITIYREEPPYMRLLDFSPSRRTVAKFRRNRSEIAQQIPLKIPYTLDDRVLVDILNTLVGHEPWPTKKYADRKVQ